MGAKYKSHEQFKTELFNKHNYTLESTYTGSRDPITFKCQNGHLLHAKRAESVLSKGFTCISCRNGRQITEYTSEDPIWLEIKEYLVEHTVEETAIKFNTTTHKIYSQLGSIRNLSNRTKEFIDILLEQDRELVEDIEEVKFRDRATIRCKEGHEVSQLVSTIMQYKHNCPLCVQPVSNLEKELREFIAQEYNGWTIYNDRTLLEGKEVDILLPDLGLAIEFNGIYWHSKQDKNYHKDKSDLAESCDFQLIHITDYNWLNKQEIVKSMLRSKLGKTTKIPARKTILKPISFPRAFLEANHIQGPGAPTALNYGLFYLGDLVAVATFAKPRFDKEADIELIRYASKLNTTVVGGLSKLLKTQTGVITTYANRDFSVAKAYKKLGFELIHVTNPALEYYKNNEYLSRYAAQSLSKEELQTYTAYYPAGSILLRKAN
jgi:hypothetical protein